MNDTQYDVLSCLTPPAFMHYVCLGEGGVISLCMCICVTSVFTLHVCCFDFIVYLILLFCFYCLLWLMLLLQREKKNAPLPVLKHCSNLHPSHPAAPPLDAMAPAISVGDTHDTEGRADEKGTPPSVCPSSLSLCLSVLLILSARGKSITFHYFKASFVGYFFGRGTIYVFVALGVKVR